MSTPAKKKPKVQKAKSTEKAEVKAVDSKLVIVGVGASAGGLEALQEFFEGAEPRDNLAYVCIQHLSPDYKSLMVELLSKNSKMNFVEAKDKELVKGGNVYMIPRKRNMTISEGRLHITDKPIPKQLNFPIDIFFKSLALEKGSDAITVILSGTGSDGSRGAGVVHLSGGTVLVQDLDEAQFDGMPKSAVDQGIVDYILPSRELQTTILNIVDSAGNVDQGKNLFVQGREKHYFEILDVLYQTYNIDFKRYKLPTIVRRLNKRMSLCRKTTLPEYLVYLKENVEELRELYNDLLIGVTRFFRDEEAWKKLEEDIFPVLMKDATAETNIKIWSAGCSRGQEAYSLAMLIDNYMRKHNIEANVKIFATDCNQIAINAAAAGIYKKADLDDSVPKSFIKRYFSENSQTYVAKQALRKSIIFSHHNVTTDPPFNNVDLLLCRNMLIYFTEKTQNEVFQFFQFSLKLNGHLFLGPSETIVELKSSFELLSRRWKIYKNIDGNRRINVNNLKLKKDGMPKVPVIARPSMGASGGVQKAIDASYKQLMKHLSGACIITDDEFRIVEAIGGYDKFISLSSDRFSLSLMKMAPPSLASAIRIGAHKARKNKEEYTQAVAVAYGDEEHTIHLSVSVLPLDELHYSQGIMVFLQNVATQKSIEAKRVQKLVNVVGEDRLLEVEEELDEMRQNLQNTIEEVETSNEELQATNEELLASNEELQSTNEELQSVNEELHTVNSEFQQKNSELASLNIDLDHLMDSTELGTLFLDGNLKIRRFTPFMGDLISLREIDIGRAINDLKINFPEKLFIADINKVIKTGENSARQIQAENGNYYLQRLVAYEGRDEVHVGGVVATFIDITENVESGIRLKDANIELERFAYIAAHDLKSPITNIKSLLEIARAENWLVKEGDEVFANIDQSVERVQSTLNSLNQIVDIKMGNELPKDKLDIQKEIDTVLLTIAELVKTADAKVKVNTEVIKHIVFPRTYFQSLIQNFLTNSIKYKAAKRKPIIKISLEEGINHIHMYIEDNGTGIDLNKHGAKLFGIFERFDLSVPGTGIGLHLVKTMMEKNGGTVEISSQVNKGTTFKLSFLKK